MLHTLVAHFSVPQLYRNIFFRFCYYAVNRWSSGVGKLLAPWLNVEAQARTPLVYSFPVRLSPSHVLPPLLIIKDILETCI
jgi:hypothetical protein